MTNNVFSGGVPTEPDVKRLMEAFPTLPVGTIVQHDQIEAVVGVARSTSRYRSVVSAWRRKLFREQNVDMRSVTKVGYEVLKPFERTKESARDFRRGVRGISKAVTRIDAVPTHLLSPEEQAKTENVQNHMASTLAVARGSAKAVAIRLGPQQQERLAPFPVQTTTPPPNPNARRR